MKQLTAIIHQGEPDEGGFWATCLEVPGANGQGETKDECLGNLAEAVQLLLDTGREQRKQRYFFSVLCSLRVLLLKIRDGGFRLDRQSSHGSTESRHAGLEGCNC
jgi:predicted RNase H-like HicB family nuclease